MRQTHSEMSGRYELCPLTEQIQILGRKLDDKYYNNVINSIKSPSDNHGLALFAKDSALRVLSRRDERVPAIAITGTQDISHEGFRVTHLIAQVAAYLGYCNVLGNTYGVDTTGMLGALSGLCEPEVFDNTNLQAGATPDIPIIVCLPSGIKSRVPKCPYIEQGVLRANGLYLSLLDSNDPLRTDLLSPRDRLMVDFCDILIVTEGGNRGVFDTVIWALEARKPVLALDWLDGDHDPNTSSYGILRELQACQPDLARLTQLLRPCLEYQTSHYRFSPAHRDRRRVTDASENDKGFTNEKEFAEHLSTIVRESRAEGQELVHLVSASQVTPKHNGHLDDWREKAKTIADEFTKIMQAVIELSSKVLSIEI